MGFSGNDLRRCSEEAKKAKEVEKEMEAMKSEEEFRKLSLIHQHLAEERAKQLTAEIPGLLQAAAEQGATEYRVLDHIGDQKKGVDYMSSEEEVRFLASPYLLSTEAEIVIAYLKTIPGIRVEKRCASSTINGRLEDTYNYWVDLYACWGAPPKKESKGILGKLFGG
jgi:hypothetical protein